jgi:biopolymer transport protein ExbD
MRLFEPTRPGYTPKVRIINLVDILLVLLLFLFVTTTFRVEQPYAVKVALPEAKTAEATEGVGKERLLITVGPDETVYLDGQAINAGDLEQALARAKAENPDLLLQFSADRAVSYGRIVSVVDAARAAGIRDITAFTRQSVK